MTVTIELSAEIEAGLAALAEAHGLSLPQYLQHLLEEQVRGGGRLSLSEIKSEHSDGVIRRELESEECVRWPEQPAAAAHPCSGKGVFSRCCNRPYKKGGGDAGVVRRRRRHGQDIPAGSSQSAVPYGHSAMAIAARWADHECPWREAAA